MNEINLNALSRFTGTEKSLSSTANSNNPSSKKVETEVDSVQFSKLPDLSFAEKALEDEFAESRVRLKDEVESPSYPPLETIDRLAHMLAVHLNPPE
jgi:hypothetical protein